MSAGLAAQYALIAALVVASAIYTLRRLAPKLTTRWQAAAAGALLAPHRSALLRRIGRALQPRDATGDCGDGCGSCNSCGTAPVAARADEQPLTFHPPHK